MKYYIFQLTETATSNYGFMSWDFARHYFNFKDYACFYIGEIHEASIDALLEEIFVQFNTNRPEDFKGHSLSVSDVVKIECDNQAWYYYCDSFGWKDITDHINTQLEEAKRNKPANLHRRAALVRAMDTLVAAVNDKSYIESWLSCGVADGDIKPDTTDEDLECYCEDGTLTDLMDLFLRIMERAKNDGGLYCDGVVSKEG